MCVEWGIDSFQPFNVTPQAERETAFRKALGDVLRELRHARGLSQDELAEASGCHVNHVSFVERGLRVPSLLVVFQLAGGLGVTPGEFVAAVEGRLRSPRDPE